jgi:hypothetical protein
MESVKEKLLIRTAHKVYWKKISFLVLSHSLPSRSVFLDASCLTGKKQTEKWSQATGKKHYFSKLLRKMVGQQMV